MRTKEYDFSLNTWGVLLDVECGWQETVTLVQRKSKLRIYESLAAMSCLCPGNGTAGCFAQNDACLESWPFSYISSVNVFAIEGGS